MNISGSLPGPPLKSPQPATGAAPPPTARGATGDRLDFSAPPPRVPLIIAHRGLPREFPENTLPSLSAALNAGANGLEIDLTLTADGRVVLWHDDSPNGLISLIRNFGQETGMKYRPTWPNLWSSHRGPVYEMTLDTFRRECGYEGPEGKARVQIPTLDQALQLLAEDPRLERLMLDIKLPPDRPDLHARMARQLKTLLAGTGLGDRVVVMHNDAGTLQRLKQGAGNGFQYSYGVEITSLFPSPDDFSAVKSGEALGNQVMDIGRPRVSWKGYETYLEILRRDRQRIDKAGGDRELIAWTINDPKEMRDVLAIGVDGIITDDPARLRRILEEEGLIPKP